MPNVIEAVKNAISTIVDDEPKFPLNIMEASYTWLNRNRLLIRGKFLRELN